MLRAEVLILISSLLLVGVPYHQHHYKRKTITSYAYLLYIWMSLLCIYLLVLYFTYLHLLDLSFFARSIYHTYTSYAISELLACFVVVVVVLVFKIVRHILRKFLIVSNIPIVLVASSSFSTILFVRFLSVDGLYISIHVVGIFYDCQPSRQIRNTVVKTGQDFVSPLFSDSDFGRYSAAVD